MGLFFFSPGQRAFHAAIGCCISGFTGEFQAVILRASQGRQRLWEDLELNHAHSKHMTARAAPPVTSTILGAAPLAVAIRIGTNKTASKSATQGIALGRAKFTVHPIHL
jgi:hypothetical protein